MNENKETIYGTSRYLSQTTPTVSFINSGFVTGQGTGLGIVYGGSDGDMWQNIAYNRNDPSVMYVKKRYPEKKIKGDLKGANDASKRLRLIKPTIIYQYIKDRFKPIEQKRLEKRFELVCEILHNAQATQQVALIEKIREKFDPFIREQELLSCGINTYINEKTLEAFVNATPNKIIKISLAVDDTGIYPMSVSDGSKSYKKRTEKMEGHNEVIIEITSRVCEIEEFLEKSQYRIEVEDALLREDISIHTDKDANIKLLVNCNDVFYWAMADCEEIKPEEIKDLVECFKLTENFGSMLWVCRKRGMRPQHPWNNSFSDEEKKLFNACGPERDPKEEG
jgi:hypothetical protein